MQFSTIALAALFAATGLAAPSSDQFDKLREGKCTGPGGQCRVTIKLFPVNKDCEMGTVCSSKGSPCFLKGRTWTRTHVSCT
ncbi:hypothetical protein PG990_001772 [Apiospora arundinis]